MAGPTRHLRVTPKAVIAVASAALELVVGICNMLFLNWMSDLSGIKAHGFTAKLSQLLVKIASIEAIHLHRRIPQQFPHTFRYLDTTGTEMLATGRKSPAMT
jgi:hypothetical protein